MERERLVCPACGADQKRAWPSGALQTTCEYCGSVILIPSRLTGLTRRCHNHPDSLAMGVCHDCGRLFCEDCLAVWTYRNTDMYVCPGCMSQRTHTRRLVLRSLVVVGAALLSIGLVLYLIADMQRDNLGRLPSSAVLGAVVAFFLLMMGPLCMCMGFLEWAQSGVTRTLKQELVRSAHQ